MTALWGVGTLPGGVALPLSNQDIEDDTRAADRALRAIGVCRRDHVVVISTNAQAGHVWPLLAALIEAGAVYAPVEPTAFDARRLETYVRRLSCRAVIGVTEDTIDGLAGLGVDPAALFADVPMVLAYPSAAGRLGRLGIPALEMCLLGPALGFGCPARHIHVDGQIWDVSAAGGGLAVTPRRQRAAWAAGRPVAIGVTGRVGAGRCPCSRDDPWVVLTQEGSK